MVIGMEPSGRGACPQGIQIEVGGALIMVCPVQERVGSQKTCLPETASRNPTCSDAERDARLPKLLGGVCRLRPSLMT
jgi:hypothetical protein